MPKTIKINVTEVIIASKNFNGRAIDTFLSHSIRLLAKLRFASDNSYFVVHCPCQVEPVLKKWRAPLGTGVKKRNENMYQKFSLNSKPAEVSKWDSHQCWSSAVSTQFPKCLYRQEETSVLIPIVCRTCGIVGPGRNPSYTRFFVVVFFFAPFSR